MPATRAPRLLCAAAAACVFGAGAGAAGAAVEGKAELAEDGAVVADRNRDRWHVCGAHAHDLPEDALVTLLSWVAKEDLPACQAVCRRWRRAGRDVRVWGRALPVSVAVVGPAGTGKTTLIGRLLLGTGTVSDHAWRTAVARQAETGCHSPELTAMRELVDVRSTERAAGRTEDTRHVLVDGHVSHLEQSRWGPDQRVLRLVSTPGSPRYFKNMVCGIAQADSACIVVDGRPARFAKGREHLRSILAALKVAGLAARPFVVAVTMLDRAVPFVDDGGADAFSDIPALVAAARVAARRRAFDDAVAATRVEARAAGIRDWDALATCVPVDSTGRNVVWSGADVFSDHAGEQHAHQPATAGKVAASAAASASALAAAGGGAAAPEPPSLLGALQALRAPEPQTQRPLRVAIDRMYRVPGVGCVLVGTVVQGIVRLEQPVKLAPSGVCTEVKSMHLSLERQPVTVGYPGEYVALALRGVDRRAIGPDTRRMGYLVGRTPEEDMHAKSDRPADYSRMYQPRARYPYLTDFRFRYNPEIQYGTAQIYTAAARPGRVQSRRMMKNAPMYAARGFTATISVWDLDADSDAASAEAAAAAAATTEADDAAASSAATAAAAGASVASAAPRKTRVTAVAGGFCVTAHVHNAQIPVELCAVRRVLRAGPGRDAAMALAEAEAKPARSDGSGSSGSSSSDSVTGRFMASQSRQLSYYARQAARETPDVLQQLFSGDVLEVDLQISGQLQRRVAVDTAAQCPRLGRFILRHGANRVIGGGLITDVDLDDDQRVLHR